MRPTKRTAPVLARELAKKSADFATLRERYANLSRTVVAQDSALNAIRAALMKLEGR